jgi:MoxR-like ATPase
MALTSEQIKTLKEHIVVKPTGKFFIFGKNSYPYTTDSKELEKIIAAEEAPKSSYIEGERLFPLLYVGNPGTGKTYQAKELADTTSRKFLRIGFKFGINFESILREYDKELGWKYTEFYKVLVSKEPAVVLFDEFNIHGVDQKSFQILLDDGPVIEVFGETIHKNPNIQYILAINPQDTQTDPISFAIEDRVIEVYFELTDKEMLGITAMPKTRFDIIKWVFQKFEIPYSIRTLQKCNLLSKEEFKQHITALLKRRKEDFDVKIINSVEMESKLVSW